ncbi:MAG TPA: TonB family protein [Terriglobales bacterium]|nr:TonB family protein [Terriglobales bacterium]
MHRAALHSMVQSIESNLGFTVLLGNPGMGKTTLVLQLLAQYRDSARTAFIFQTQCKRYELLRYLASELELPVNHDEVSLHQRLKEMLVDEARAGRKVLIVIDEAQNLHQSSLEAIRLLSDFETARAKLLHIILAGSSRLGETLLAPELSQLAQRVSTVCRLEPLAPEEVKSYVTFRLRVAGCDYPDSLFSSDALVEVAQRSEGIPRMINSLCYRALSIASAAGKRRVSSFMVSQAAKELDLSSSPGAVGCSTAGSRLGMEGTFGIAPEEKDTKQEARTAKVIDPTLLEKVAEQRTQLRSATISGLQNTVERKPPALLQEKADLARHRNKADTAPADATKPNSPQRGTRPGRVRGDPQSFTDDRFALALMVLILLVSALWVSWYELRGSATTRQAAAAEGIARAGTDGDSRELVSRLPEMLSIYAPEVGPGSLGVKHGAASGNKPQALIQTLPQAQPSRIHPPAASSDQPVVPATAMNVGVMSSNVIPPLVTSTSQLPAVPQLGAEPATASTLSAAREPVEEYQTFLRKPIKVVWPKYPKLAELRHIEGDVLLELYVNPNGKVQRVRTLSGNSVLIEAAEEAARQWQYAPLPSSQSSSPAVTRVRFNFTLNPETKR